jgi:hypothetical protein
MDVNKLLQLSSLGNIPSIGMKQMVESLEKHY